MDDQGFPMIMLSTYNMPVFNRFRAQIRGYQDSPNFLFDTYPKDEFIEKKTASIYVSHRFKCFGPTRMMEALLGAYPGLHAEYTLLHQHTFETNLPGRPDRAGDAILVLGGHHFLDKLSRYPEEFVFHISRRWRFTIKGGPRKPHDVTKYELERAAFDLRFSRELSTRISPTAGAP